VRSTESADSVWPGLRRLTGDIEPARKYFQIVLEMEAPEDLHGLARNGLRGIAARELEARGAEEGRRSYIRLGMAALSREVAGGDSRDRLRGRDAGAA